MMGSMPKVTQQHRDARREQILAAARRCFLRDGFHATSMQDLFAESGLSSGAVYSYFASKDDVIVAIAEENMRGVTEMITAAATQHPGRSAGAVLADIMDMVRAQDAETGLGKLTVIVWSEALRNPQLAARFTDMITQIRARLAEVIEQGSQSLPADVLPADVLPADTLPADTLAATLACLPADTLAATLTCLLPGYLLQLAILGPAAVDGVPGAVRTLWPA